MYIYIFNIKRMCGYGRRIHYFYGENYKNYSTEYKVEMIEPGRFSFRNF